MQQRIRLHFYASVRSGNYWEHIMINPQETARHRINNGATSIRKLWILYVANGGNAPLLEFEAIIYGALPCTSLDLRVLDFALREPMP